MQVDPEYLRQHYNSLSDEALLDIDRDDLIEAAKTYYDAEVKSRGLAGGDPTAEARHDPAGETEPYDEDSEDLEMEDLTNGEEEPAWLPDAAEVYSVYAAPGGRGEERLSDIRQILEEARIPCYMELVEVSAEERQPISETHRWRL